MQDETYPVGALIAVKTFDGPVEVRRVLAGLNVAEDPGYVAAEGYLQVNSERVDGSDASVGVTPMPLPPRGEPGPVADDMLDGMGYHRSAGWQTLGYAKVWSALLRETVTRWDAQGEDADA